MNGTSSGLEIISLSTESSFAAFRHTGINSGSCEKIVKIGETVQGMILTGNF